MNLNNWFVVFILFFIAFSVALFALYGVYLIIDSMDSHGHLTLAIVLSLLLISALAATDFVMRCH